jgi:hypothetical protein
VRACGEPFEHLRERHVDTPADLSRRAAERMRTRHLPQRPQLPASEDYVEPPVLAGRYRAAPLPSDPEETNASDRFLLAITSGWLHGALASTAIPDHAATRHRDGGADNAV